MPQMLLKQYINFISKKFGIFNISFRKNYSLAEIVEIISKFMELKPIKNTLIKKLSTYNIN